MTAERAKALLREGLYLAEIQRNALLALIERMAAALDAAEAALDLCDTECCYDDLPDRRHKDGCDPCIWREALAAIRALKDGAA